MTGWLIQFNYGRIVDFEKTSVRNKTYCFDGSMSFLSSSNESHQPQTNHLLASNSPSKWWETPSSKIYSPFSHLSWASELSLSMGDVTLGQSKKITPFGCQTNWFHTDSCALYVSSPTLWGLSQPLLSPPFPTPIWVNVVSCHWAINGPKETCLVLDLFTLRSHMVECITGWEGSWAPRRPAMMVRKRSRRS